MKTLVQLTKQAIKTKSNSDIEQLVDGLKLQLQCGHFDWNQIRKAFRVCSEPENAASDTAKNAFANAQALKDNFTVEQIGLLIWPWVVEEEGFSIVKFEQVNRISQWPDDKSFNGIITKHGYVIAGGYMCHQELYPLLFQLDLVEDSDWTDEETAIHISSGQLNGDVAHCIGENYRSEEIVTVAQLETLCQMKDLLHGSYGRNEEVMNLLRSHTARTHNKGGKYNNLKFLELYYPQINLPSFTLDQQLLFKFTDDAVFVRTSPKDSIPGLLNSRLVRTVEGARFAVDAINQEFDKVKHVGKKSRYIDGKDHQYTNELYIMYQQYLEGPNGVCHYTRDKEFTYSVSHNQGDVVQGKVSNQMMGQHHETQLRSIAAMLSRDLKCDIQLEFVIKDSRDLHIVQMRTFEPNDVNVVFHGIPQEAFVVGKTFTQNKGDKIIDVQDILIVTDDAQSHQLLGKKALIVTNDVEFSHILALSKTLGIPSIYATGDVDLDGVQQVEFNAYFKQGWLTKQ